MKRLFQDRLLLLLLALLLPLWVLAQPSLITLPTLVAWDTIAALAALMVLSQGLSESGFLARAGRALMTRIHSERGLAAALVLFSAALAAVITNDVALFILVPLTLSLGRLAQLPLGRLVIFEALAVNAGSAASPIGNPQNLFLWQTSNSSFYEFLTAMLPLAAIMLLLLLLLIPLAFPARRITISPPKNETPVARSLFLISLLLYLPVLIAIEFGLAEYAAVLLVLGYGLWAGRTLKGVDWALLLVFVLMFLNLGLLAQWPPVASQAQNLLNLPGEALMAGALLSQAISNVPAALFLTHFTDDWRALAWGVNIGGFGLVIGSMANLIALRLARQPGMWRDFHRWSVPLFFLSLTAAWLL